MRHHTTLLLALLGASCCLAQYPLFSDNGMADRGKQGPEDLCPYEGSIQNYSRTFALEFLYEDLGHLDNVGGEGLKLYCRDSQDMVLGYVSSLEGSYGEWRGIKSCAAGEVFRGFRIRVMPYQGTFGDDFGVDNVQMACTDGVVVDGLEGVLKGVTAFPDDDNDVEVEKTKEANEVKREWQEIDGQRVLVVTHRIGDSEGEPRLHGEWGSWEYCDEGMYIIGLRTTVEDGHIDDDAGLTDVVVYCI